MLRARLLGAGGPCFLRAELDEHGRPLPSTDAPAVSDEADWWPAAKLFARHLTPWMAATEPGREMKRSPELAPLSRDHHVALEHALRLRRASEEDVAAVVAGFLAFLLGPGRAHFAQEEELLAPEVPEARADLARRMLDEHAEILRRAERLGRGSARGRRAARSASC